MKVKYDTIGKNYNQTRKADPYLTERLFHHLNPEPEKLYLDIGCGTGNYTDALYNRGVNFIGIDPSEKMLQKAKVKNSNIDWRKGTAEQTGLEENSIDGIMGSLTMHHWTSLEKGFLELSNVLKPKGQIVVFTATPEQMKGYWLNHYFPKMLNDSIIQMPSFQNIESAMQNAGFNILKTEKYNIQPDLIDQFLYCGKQNPNLYLDPSIRNGISSFSHLANLEEVKKGLYDLEQDINTGRIDEIMQSYENSNGDYLYIIAQNL